VYFSLPLELACEIPLLLDLISTINIIILYNYYHLLFSLTKSHVLTLSCIRPTSLSHYAIGPSIFFYELKIICTFAFLKSVKFIDDY